MYNETRINQFLEGRGFNVVATIVFVVATVSYATVADMPADLYDRGWCLPSCNLWIGGRFASALLNIACVVAAGYMLKHLNRLHGFIRANAAIGLSAFLMLEAATLGVSAYFAEGTAMLVVMVMSAYILFNTYQQRVSQRSIFIVFALLSFYSMFQFTSLYLWAVFFLGFVQMRVMRLRGFIAMLLGILTPYWIMYGFGMVTPDDFDVPPINGFWQMSVVDWPFVGTCVVTALAALSLMMSNMMRIISYNAKRRACNGFFSVLTISTIIMMCLDFYDMSLYLPTLNMCLAVQVGHSFTMSNNDKRYVPVLVLCALCIGLYVFNFMRL